jgi:sterol desaturase/sphingolipid hydroxylase (fatty acid hydroxylase superfamily)
VYLVALPVVLCFALLEALVLSRQRPGSYDWRAAGVSVLDQVLRRLVGLVPLSLAAPVFGWAHEHRLLTLTLDGPLQLLVLFFGQELCYYAYHRASHRVRWFWLTHWVHHTSNQLNLSAALRLGITGRWTGTLLFFSPLVLLGFEPALVIATLTINLLYQFWLHANWIPKLGFLEGWLNTPSAHRVHHASNVDYLDANFGGVLLVFDRLFGTYRPERDDLSPVYGLVKPIHTYKPWVIELGQWAALAQDLRSARSLRDVLGYFLAPPGWRPQASQGGRSDAADAGKV